MQTKIIKPKKMTLKKINLKLRNLKLNSLLIKNFKNLTNLLKNLR